MASMTGSQGERNSSPDPIQKLKPAPPRGVWATRPERSQSLSAKPFVLNAKASSFVPSPRPSVTEKPFEADSRLRAPDGGPVPALALLEAGRKSLSETWARGGDRRDIVVEQLEHIRARRRSNSISLHSKSSNKETSSRKKKPYQGGFMNSMPNKSTRKSEQARKETREEAGPNWEPSCTITDLPGGGRMSFSDQVHLSDRMSLEKRLSTSSRGSRGPRGSTGSNDSAGMSVWDVRKSLVDLKIAASTPPTPIDYANSCKRRSFQFDQLKKWTDTPESTGRRSSSSLMPQSPKSARSYRQPPHSPWSAGSFRESLPRESRSPMVRLTSVTLESPDGLVTSITEAAPEEELELLDDAWLSQTGGAPATKGASNLGSRVVQESLKESLKESASLPLGATAVESAPRLSTELPENTIRPFNADADGNPIVKLDSLIKMGRNGAPRNGGGCYGCGMPGHFFRDCPERFRAPKHKIPLDRPPASYLQEKGLTLEHSLKPGDPGWSPMEEEESRAEMEWRNRWGRIPPLQSDRHDALRAACVKRAERKWLWENLEPMDH